MIKPTDLSAAIAEARLAIELLQKRIDDISPLIATLQGWDWKGIATAAQEEDFSDAEALDDLAKAWAAYEADSKAGA